MPTKWKTARRINVSISPNLSWNSYNLKGPQFTNILQFYKFTNKFTIYKLYKHFTMLNN